MNKFKFLLKFFFPKSLTNPCLINVPVYEGSLLATIFCPSLKYSFSIFHPLGVVITFSTVNMKTQFPILFTLILITVVGGEMKDPVAFTAIKGTVNGPYIAFQTLLVNNNVSSMPVPHVPSLVQTNFRCRPTSLLLTELSSVRKRESISLRFQLFLQKEVICEFLCGLTEYLLSQFTLEARQRTALPLVLDFFSWPKVISCTCTLKRVTFTSRTR